MKTNSIPKIIDTPPPCEDAIRDYAYHLYCLGGCRPGHDLEDWLEAEACLLANIPKHEAHTRLHRHLHGLEAA